MESVKGFRPVALNIGVRNLEQAIEFYEGAFGAKLDVSEADGRPSQAHWQFGEGDSFFLFNLRQRAPDDPHRDHISAFGFNVNDLEATHRRAIAPAQRNTSLLWTSRVYPVTHALRIRAGTGSSSGRREAGSGGAPPLTAISAEEHPPRPSTLLLHDASGKRVTQLLRGICHVRRRTARTAIIGRRWHDG